MPKRPQGVYRDARGGWYLKVTLGSDPLTGKGVQVTKRGYRTAAEAGRRVVHVVELVSTVGSKLERSPGKRP